MNPASIEAFNHGGGNGFATLTPIMSKENMISLGELLCES
jgi:hypothetical protein